MKIQRNRLNAEIERLTVELEKTEVGTPRYSDLENRLEQLVRIKNEKRLISWGEGLGIAANLVGIIAVINHERIGIITTKAFSLIRKGRV